MGETTRARWLSDGTRLGSCGICPWANPQARPWRRASAGRGQSAPRVGATGWPELAARRLDVDDHAAKVRDSLAQGALDLDGHGMRLGERLAGIYRAME